MSLTPADQKKRQLQRELQLKLVSEGDLPSCFSCPHFDKKVEICNRWGGKRPPLDWLLVGCMEWEPDIPF